VKNVEAKQIMVRFETVSPI